jgi:hypothetical protein
MIIDPRTDVQMARRKVQTVWGAIEHQRPSQISIWTWKRSYEGIVAALMYLGFTVVTTKQEFNDLPIPQTSSGTLEYMRRKIKVCRADKEKTSVNIRDLLNGSSQVRTNDEIASARTKLRFAKQEVMPKGQPCSHLQEQQASRELTMLVGDCNIHKTTLWEGRVADVAYCYRHDNKTGEVFVADQEKSAVVSI